MRVLIATALWPNLERPLLGSHVRAQVESLATVGVECEVVSPSRRGRIVKYVELAGQVNRRLRTEHFDLVHAHYGFSGIAARLQWKRPLIVTFHGSDLIPRTSATGQPTVLGRVERICSSFLCRYVDGVIVVSREMANALGEIPCEVIPVGVDLSMFRPIGRATARRILGLSDDRKYVLFVGEPTHMVKRFWLAEQAIELVRGAHPQAELIVANGQTPTDMPIWLSAADVLLLTSITEGSPVVVKEALACELPVVSVPVGDVAARIAGADQCKVVDATPQTLASAVNQILTSGLRSSNGRKVVSSTSSTVLAKQILDVYERVLETSGRGRRNHRVVAGG